MAWVEGTVLNDRYIIAKEIGNGGFGLTYLAYKRGGNNNKVAIKTLKDAYAFDPIWHDEFRKEILSLSKCNHPQIVTIEDFGDYKSGLFSRKSQLYMVMEYIKGQTVFEKMRSREKQGKSPRFSENNALFYIRQVASALVFAHDRHPPILHRDLKPQNIMLREDRQEAVLIDFGLARDVAANPVSTAKLTFSSGFAPIEQYSYKPIRLPTTDVYGLAATLYYMLTAKVPTDANDRAQGKQLINPKEYNPNISEQTCQAIMQGLAFKLEDRPQMMQKWLDLLPLHKQIQSQRQINRKSGLGIKKADPMPEKVDQQAPPTLEPKTASKYFSSASKKQNQGDKQGAIAAIACFVIYMLWQQFESNKRLSIELEAVDSLKMARRYQECIDRAKRISTNGNDDRVQSLLQECQSGLNEIESKAQLLEAKKFAADNKLEDALRIVAKINTSSSVYSDSLKLAEQWSSTLLVNTTQKYQEEGKLQEAIALLKVIPKNLAKGKAIEQLPSKWQAEWNANETTLKSANNAIKESRWNDAIAESKKITTLYWQKQTEAIVQKANAALVPVSLPLPAPEPQTQPNYEPQPQPQPNYEPQPQPQPNYEPQPQKEIKIILDPVNTGR